MQGVQGVQGSFQSLQSLMEAQRVQRVQGGAANVAPGGEEEVLGQEELQQEEPQERASQEGGGKEGLQQGNLVPPGLQVALQGALQGLLRDHGVDMMAQALRGARAYYVRYDTAWLDNGLRVYPWCDYYGHMRPMPCLYLTLPICLCYANHSYVCAAGAVRVLHHAPWTAAGAAGAGAASAARAAAGAAGTAAGTAAGAAGAAGRSVAKAYSKRVGQGEGRARAHRAQGAHRWLRRCRPSMTPSQIPACGPVYLSGECKGLRVLVYLGSVTGRAEVTTRVSGGMLSVGNGYFGLRVG